MRRVLGIILLCIGLFLLLGAILNPHVRWSSDVGDMDNWFFWSMFMLPIGLGLLLLFGKRLRQRRGRTNTHRARRS